MIPHQRSNDIVSAFQRYRSSNDTSEIDTFTLKELRSADEFLGARDLNKGFRIALKNKIKDLELNESRTHESKVRAWQLVTTLIVGLTVGGLSVWLFNT